MLHYFTDSLSVRLDVMSETGNVYGNFLSLQVRLHLNATETQDSQFVDFLMHSSFLCQAGQ
jgi:hypothetical protein